MKIGFFGGCFNPPSYIHINLANNLIEEYKLDKIVFVPVGDYYEKEDLISSEHRCNMLNLATAKYFKLEVDTIAANFNKKLYAVDTFKLIKEKYKNCDMFFIMGSDNFRKMPSWKEYEYLINNCNIIVIERERKQIRKTNKKNIYAFIPERLTIIDSTTIRRMIKNNENVLELLDKDVLEYIKKNNLYLT